MRCCSELPWLIKTNIDSVIFTSSISWCETCLSHFSPKKHCSTSEICQRPPWRSITVLVKCLVDRWNDSRIVWEEHTTLWCEKKPHTNMKTLSHENFITVKYGEGSIVILDLDSYRRTYIPKFINVSNRIMSEWLSASWSSGYSLDLKPIEMLWNSLLLLCLLFLLPVVLFSLPVH